MRNRKNQILKFGIGEGVDAEAKFFSNMDVRVRGEHVLHP